MVQPGIGLDTPRTNLGDATYLSRAPDFDMTQEPSFQSPSKEPNVFQSLRNGGPRPSLRTPRGQRSRAPFGDKMNMPGGIGGAEFTPLLKSATRNSARRRSGKENGLTTPALGKIQEDTTPLQAGESSMYRSRDASTLDRTPLPDLDSDSTAETPLVMKHGARQGNPLQDGQQLSLREQENVIDKIEKENFGLKLKIHFLEEALRKAGPGFSEAALKENTELKVDKVTMQRELQKYKKHLTSAEKDLEAYRQQLTERKQGSGDHSAELKQLRRDLEDKDADIQDLQHQLHSDRQNIDSAEKLQDEIGDLEADLREKERIISDRDDELDELRSKARQADERGHHEADRLRDQIHDLQADLREKERVIGENEDNLEGLQSRVKQAEDKAKKAQLRMIELEERAQASGKLKEARETIQDLESNMRGLERQIHEMKDKLEDAVAEKDRAEEDLEELQEEMANKSVVTKGLPRQLEEKVTRLQDEVELARQDYESLEHQFNTKQKEADDLRLKLKESRQERDASDSQRRSIAAKLEELQAELHARSDEKNLLQMRHDALTAESASLQRDVSRLKKTVSDLKEDLNKERQHTVDIERDIRLQYKVEVDKMNNVISDLQAEVRERENLYDNDSEKWETERHNLESKRDRAEERVLGLQKTIEKLREAEGSLNNKESKLQQALQSETERHQNEEVILKRQVEDLQEDLSSRQQSLEDLRNELSAVRDELRQAQLDKQAESDKIESLEDEIEVLQATLDEESERSAQEIEKLTKECDDLRQELKELRRATDSARATTDASRQTAGLNAKAIERLEKQVDEYRLSLSKATQEKKMTDRECDDLRQQLKELRKLSDSAKASTDVSRDAAEQHAKTVERLQTQLSDYKSDLQKAQSDKRNLQAQLSKVKIELDAVSSRLAETEAERDEVEAELLRAKQHDNDTFQIDQERINLRASKARLDSEIKRLREENKNLAEQRDSLEKTFEDELEKAEAEEDRLNQEIISLQAKVRAPINNQEAIKARRTIRDLERKIEDYQHQLAQTTMPIENLEGNSEISLIKRDLTAARKKELEYMQKESDNKSAVRDLKRQIGDLERRIHEADISRLVQSPLSDSASARKAEVSELRHQLSAAHQSIHDLKKTLRESERRASMMEHDVQQRLDEVEDEKLALEQALEDAEQAAEEVNADLLEARNKYKLKAEKYKKERDSVAAKLAEARRNRVNDTVSSMASTVDSEMTREERHDLYEILRKTQIDADALEREVREHKEALTELAEVERSLRIKLDRARSERARYRSDVEQLQRDMQALKSNTPGVDKLQHRIKSLKKAKRDAEALAKAAMAQASVARARHTVSTFPPITVAKEDKGKQKETQRAPAAQSSSRIQPRPVEIEDVSDDSDNDVVVVNDEADDNAARVIQFKDDNDTQMHTDAIVRAAEAAEHRHAQQMSGMVMQMEWMQARWERELRMRDDAAFAKDFLISELNVKEQCNKADLLQLEALVRQMQQNQRIAHTPLPASKQGPGRNSQRAPSFKRVVNAVRFVVRLRLMARAWKEQEQVRKTLLAKFEEQERLEAQSHEGSLEQQAQPPSQPPPKPVAASSKPITFGQQQIKVKHIERLQQQHRQKIAEHLRFGGAMSVDLEASSSTARDEDQHHDAHHHHVDVGADSAAEMWLSGDEEIDGHGRWRREDFVAPSALMQPRVEDAGLDGTEAISVDSN